MIEGGKITGSISSGSKETKALPERSRVEIMIGSSSANIKLAKQIEVRD
jgi:hypothetical protein